MQTTLTATPGFLKVITNEIRSDLRVDSADARSAIRQDALDGDANLLRRPDTYVIHDVVALEPHPVMENMFRAITAEGDFVDGSPKALYDRLTEYQRG